MGYNKIGVAVALLNSNIKAENLLQSILTCKPKILIVGIEVIDHALPIVKQLKDNNIKLFVDSGLHSEFEPYDSVIKSQPITAFNLL